MGTKTSGLFIKASLNVEPVGLVESDGTELIVIRRKDLSTEDEKRKLLALADNHTSDTSRFNFSAIVEDFDIDKLGDWKMDIPFDDIPADIDSFFVGSDKTEKQKKVIVCPHCGKAVEI